MHHEYVLRPSDKHAQVQGVLEDLLKSLSKKTKEYQPGAVAAAGVLSYADYFAMMPPDNQNPINPGCDIAFSQDGPIGGESIARAGESAFKLITPGVYQVLFQVSVVAEGQLILTLNDTELTNTAAGRFASEAQITGMVNVLTATPNAILTLRNPIKAPWAIRLRNSAGGGLPVSAHLLITRLS